MVAPKLSGPSSVLSRAAGFPSQHSWGPLLCQWGRPLSLRVWPRWLRVAKGTEAFGVIVGLEEPSSGEVLRTSLWEVRSGKQALMAGLAQPLSLLWRSGDSEAPVRTL